MAKKNDTKKISMRTYFNYFLVMVVIILLCFIGVKMLDSYNTNKLSDSVLTRTIGTIQIDEIDNASKEMTSNDFILISYTKSKDNKNFETKLKKIIINNDLQNNFFYLDATDLMLEDDYISSINNKLGLTDENEIISLPSIIYYKDGKIVNVLTGKNGEIITVDDFTKMLDTYEVLESK